MMNIKRQTSAFFAIILLAILPICNALAQTHNSAHHTMNENNFFTLDFAQGDVALSDVETHFFTTFPHDDPTQGDVVYDRKLWVNENMIVLDQDGRLKMSVKSRDVDNRFDSVRLTSKSFYNLNDENPRVLFVFKGKLPSGQGIWPAWWLNGSYQHEWIYQNPMAGRIDADLDRLSGLGHFYDTPSAVNGTDWPGAGEIDIIETINGHDVIHNTIHTCPQMCDSEWNDDGQIINCANATSFDPNAGCSGRTYHAPPEGTFACLWEKDQISFYYWEPGANVRAAGGPLSQDPDPDSWPSDYLKNWVKLLETDTDCDREVHQQWQCANCQSSTTCVFTNIKMIFNITLCGKWAGREFDNTDDAWTNCREFIAGEGRDQINGQCIRIDYVSVKKI